LLNNQQSKYEQHPKHTSSTYVTD